MSQPASNAAPKNKKSPLSTVILILMGILFPLCTIEGVARLIPTLIPLEIRSVFQNEQPQELKGLTPDETLGYKYAPNLIDFPVPFDNDKGEGTYHISTVSLGYTDAGFRDDGLGLNSLDKTHGQPGDKNSAEPFTVVIGDSYASCASVEMEECWVELIERQTRQDWADLGVVGYGPQQELGMLAKYGLPLRPKQVVWVFFANDLNDAWRFDQFGSGGFKQGKFWQNPLQAWLARNSTIYTIGSFFWYNRFLFYNLAQADGVTVPRDSNLVWWLTNTDLNIPEVAEGLALTQQSLLEARRQTQASDSNTQFMVLILPFREQVYAPAVLQPRFDQLNQALADFCQQHSLVCLDLTSALREKAKTETDPIYYRKDIHFNVRGNQIVADLLIETLKAH